MGVFSGQGISKRFGSNLLAFEWNCGGPDPDYPVQILYLMEKARLVHSSRMFIPWK